MKYKVTIEELLVRQIEVEADNREEAIEKVEDQWYKGDIVLTADDFSEVTFGSELFDLSTNNNLKVKENV